MDDRGYSVDDGVCWMVTCILGGVIGGSDPHIQRVFFSGEFMGLYSHSIFKSNIMINFPCPGMYY